MITNKIKRIVEQSGNNGSDVIIAKILDTSPFRFRDLSDDKLILTEDLVAIPERFLNPSATREADIRGRNGAITWREGFQSVTKGLTSFRFLESEIEFKDNPNELFEGDTVILISYQGYNKYVLMDRLEKVKRSDD